jgi:oxygen-independent coproporphyrinogen-3 oxidase
MAAIQTLADAAPTADPRAWIGAPEGVAHVYVHVPFCARKCPYCDFNSHADRDAEIDAYLGALLEEARALVPGARARTLFVGGGTPTHPSAAAIERYLGGLLEVLDASALEEVTVEANPGSLDRAKVRALRRAGVHRVSLGVQSFHDRHLRTLGRIHDASDAVRSVELLREGGIERISVDLILAVAGQTLEDQARDVRRALDLDPEHVSAYVLAIEEGTLFERAVREGRMAPPDDDRDLAHLEVVTERLAEAGFARYEISNYARPGAECRHNLAYWRDADWVGLGAGAHSHVGARRWKNADDPAAYVASVRARGHAAGPAEVGDPETRLFEALMMGLRLAEGVDLADLAARTGLDPRVRHAAALERNAAEGLLRQDGDRVRLTARGFDLASAVIRDFLP